MTDVVCVGGSVAGAAAAGFLARAGKRVIVLDRAEFPRWKACGEGILPHGSAVLERLGVDLPDATTIRGIRFAVARGTSGHSLVSAWLPFPGRAGRALSRHVLDAAIRARAAELGAEFVRARAIRVEPGRVLTDRGIFEAPLLIGADGTRSLFHECLGIRVRPGRDRVGFSSHWEGALTEPGEVNVTAFRGGELYMAPVDAGLTLATLLVERRFLQQGGVSMRGIPAFLRERFPDRFARARRAGPILGAFPLGTRVERIAGDGWLLVGDAAGAIDPISGEGLSLALRGAEIASDVVLGGWDPARYTARMRELRRPIERLTGFMLFLARHPRLAGMLFRHEKRLAPMMRVAVGES
jgi:flavin-dependent dehydrogenase